MYLLLNNTLGIIIEYLGNPSYIQLQKLLDENTCYIHLSEPFIHRNKKYNIMIVKNDALMSAGMRMNTLATKIYKISYPDIDTNIYGNVVLLH